MTDITEQKREMRIGIKAKLAALTEAEMAAQSVAACNAVAALARFSAARLILAYMPLPGECSTLPLIEMAQKAGKRVAFPRCVGDDLKLYVPRAMLPGAYGVLEPDPALSELAEPGDIDLAVVPGLAFDKLCGRLGRGKGYYDRLLCGLGAYKVGMALSVQLVERVPMEGRDVYMDAVAANNWIYCK